MEVHLLGEIKHQTFVVIWLTPELCVETDGKRNWSNGRSTLAHTLSRYWAVLIKLINLIGGLGNWVRRCKGRAKLCLTAGPCGVDSLFKGV